MPNFFCFALSFLLLLRPCDPRQEERTALDQLTPLFRIFRAAIGVGVKGFTESRVNRELLESRDKALDRHLEKFPCDLAIAKRSPEVPKSAHEIRPADIDVIGAIGDSLTAGVGVSASFFVLESYEDRGKSFAIGGQGNWKTYLTLPNILKEFNPKLFGYSRGASTAFQQDSQFNLAELGAISRNMPFMANTIIKRIKEDPRVDVNNHWKLITHMIGNNDFCSDICYQKKPYDTLEKHKEDLIQVLRLFRDNLPRTIVLVVPPPNLRELTRWHDLSPFCKLTHSVFCPCIKGLSFKKNQKIFFDIMDKWQKMDIEVSNMPEFDLDDFTVIAPLFLNNYTFPKTERGTIDYGYLAPDCFHFSEKGHAKVANDLWNSLLEPFGNKSTDGTVLYTKFNCPTERYPYIFTRRNSPMSSKPVS